MKHSATSSEAFARAPWPLPEPTLTYFPNARFALSDRDLDVRAIASAAKPGAAGRPPTGRAGAVRRDIRGGGVAVPEDTSDFGHVPVLADRCVALLAPALTRHNPDGSGALLVDATLGAGGHAERFLTGLPGLRLIGLDRDPTALDIAGRRLAPFGDRVRLIHIRYDGLPAALSESGYVTTSSVDGILFDLGVSSMQLDRSERGFSYAKDAPLDMRMDPTSPLTAGDIVNTYDEGALTDILRRYGEERFARRIAAEIVRRRVGTPFTSTVQLVELIYQVIPAPARRTGGHPAKRTFQALRVAVNGELDSLASAVPAALDALTAAGRVVVLAYQSLEDRIVKQAFADATASRTPTGLPVELPGHAPQFTSLTRGAERADDAEILRNPRSAAVRLRAVERIRERTEYDGQAAGRGDR